jgi:hypothetical protein
MIQVLPHTTQAPIQACSKFGGQAGSTRIFNKFVCQIPKLGENEPTAKMLTNYVLPFQYFVVATQKIVMSRPLQHRENLILPPLA